MHREAGLLLRIMRAAGPLLFVLAGAPGCSALKRSKSLRRQVEPW
jgi:hypothetical protein